jgi:uncharacterized protein (DUF2164 family)
MEESRGTLVHRIRSYPGTQDTELPWYTGYGATLVHRIRSYLGTQDTELPCYARRQSYPGMQEVELPSV